MEDPDCRDQYSVIYDSGEKTGIFSNDVKEPIEVEERAVRNVDFSSVLVHTGVLYALFKNTYLINMCTCFSFSAGQKRTCAGLPKAPT